MRTKRLAPALALAAALTMAGCASPATIDEIDVKPICNGTSAFRAQVIVIVGSGAVRTGTG